MNVKDGKVTPAFKFYETYFVFSTLVRAWRRPALQAFLKCVWK